MAENENDPPEAAPHDSAADHEAHEHDHFAHEHEAPAQEAEHSEAAESAPTPRKSRGFGQKFTLLVAALGLFAIIGGGAAIVFKDKDERLRAIADAIEAAGRDPKGFFAEQEAMLGAWLTKTLPQDGAGEAKAPPLVAEKAAPPVAPEERASAEAPTPPSPAPGWANPADVRPASPAAKTEAPATAAQLERPAAAASPAANAESAAELAALVKRLGALEGSVRDALDAANEARRLANGKTAEGGAKPGRAPAPEEDDRFALLEGRIDAMADEIAKLREKLDQPKIETRVAPEVDQAVRAAQGKALAAVETLALTQSLHRELERGRGFAGELDALKDRGADAQLLAALAPYAERGAPSGKDLLAVFAPIGKRLRASEDAAAPGASLTDQLLRDAQKLVRVRPVTEGAKPTVDVLVPLIEKALARDDLAAAADAFVKLPDAAKTQAKDFGDSLSRRQAAEQAAATLLANAIAGLGHAKN